MEMLFEKENKNTFFVDAMLGNIAKKLRLMGFDCMYNASIVDDELMRLAKKDDRVIISRDQLLVRKSLNLGIKAIFLEKIGEFDQLVEILKKLNLKKIEIRGDSARCPKCNYKTEYVKKENICNKIPKKVVEQNEKFWICKNCNKIFWEGSHIKNLQKLVDELNDRQ